MVGRRPVPTALKVLRGNPGQRRLNAHEPIPPPPATADPPADLPEAARVIWQAHAPELVRLGVLTVVDRDEFALGCRLRALGMAALKDSEDGPPLRVLQMLRQSSSIFARFGIGASDRSRISVAAPKKPESKWAGLIGGKKA